MASNKTGQKRRQSHSTSQKPKGAKDSAKPTDKKNEPPESSKGSEKGPDDTQDYKARPSKAYESGLIIETAAQLQIRQSTTTPTRLPSGTRGNTRVRRFAIIESAALDDNSKFYALPISTYEGQGVAKAGVDRYKHHHAIIYTRSEPPIARSDEQPERLPNGGSGPGLLPYSIRVEPKHRNVEGYALDPMSRLNFGQIHSFDDSYKVKIFGHVKSMSKPNFDTLFRHVWQHAMPYVSQHHSQRSQDEDNESDENHEKPAVQVNDVAESSADAVRRRNDSVTDRISPESLAQYLDKFRLSAREQDLPAPKPLNDTQLRQLADNKDLREQYMQNLRSRLVEHRELQKQRESRGDDEEEDDDDDEDEND